MPVIAGRPVKKGKISTRLPCTLIVLSVFVFLVERAMLSSPPPLPREHGAWAMLVIALVVGSVAAGPPTMASLAIVPAMALLFLSRYAALPAATRLAKGRNVPEGYLARRFQWSGFYLASSGTFLLAAVAATVPSSRASTVATAMVTGVLGSTHAGLALVGRDRTVWGEIIGLTGLACSAPLVMCAAGRPLDGRAWSAGALCLGYFVSSLAYVRAYRRRSAGAGGRAAVLECLGVHAVVLASVIGLEAEGWLPAGASWVYAPVVFRTAWGLARPAPSLRAVGSNEVVVASAFLLLAVVAFAAEAGRV